MNQDSHFLKVHEANSIVRQPQIKWFYVHFSCFYFTSQLPCHCLCHCSCPSSLYGLIQFLCSGHFEESTVASKDHTTDFLGKTRPIKSRNICAKFGTLFFWSGGAGKTGGLGIGCVTCRHAPQLLSLCTCLCEDIKRFYVRVLAKFNANRHRHMS